MPRLFLGNFDFEHRLADPKYIPTAKLKRLNAELASSWVSIAEEGDWIWTPESIDSTFFRELERLGLPKIFFVTSLEDVPRGVECLPWGWSSEVRQLSERFGWSANAPSDMAARIANSRATSFELEQKWGIGLPGACRIESLDELRAAIDVRHNDNFNWVVKAEFSMSARERILGKGFPNIQNENWVRRRLATHGVVFFEPWVDRIDEFGIQIEIPLQGLPKLIGLTRMLVNPSGQYAGSHFSRHELPLVVDRMETTAIEACLRASTHLQSIGYFGPVGIDAMIYRDTEGMPQIRPLQDINARWTVGRLSLGWLRLLTSGQNEGVWQHFVYDGDDERALIPTNALMPAGQNRIVVIRTSPSHVGNSCCQHQSRILMTR